jgi:hypothetical protein
VTTSAHPGGALLLEITSPDKKRVIRQGYLGRGQAVFILTLAAPAPLSGAYVRPFDETLRNLIFTLPVPEPPTPELPMTTPEPPAP